MATRIISTPVPTMASRSAIEAFAENLDKTLRVNSNDLSNVINICKTLKLRVNSYGFGGTSKKELRLISWDDTSTEIWPSDFIGMYSTNRENIETLTLISHYLLHVPKTRETYGAETVVEVPRNIYEEDEQLKRARYEAYWLALYLAYPHDKLSASIKQIGLDNTRRSCYITTKWFDACVIRLNAIRINNGLEPFVN